MRTAPSGGWYVDLEAIDRARVLQGWTRGELARRARVDPGTVSGVFRGRRTPALGTVEALATAIGLTLHDVIRFTNTASERPYVSRSVKIL